GETSAGEPVTSEQGLVDKARDSGLLSYLITAPLMHGAGQWVAVSGLLGGQRVVLLDGARVSPERAWDLVERESVMSMAIVGDAMGRPLADTLESNAGRWDTS